ncbi:glycine-rich protein DOT1-like [Vigna umbellata]|uniref:glycine-rich protein DOT1-like n=1 Tax=Vigna umbellata TaxID=87088 RepID=UPI001F5FC11B|nr:glycine-rich protein DOT1-like [Vigna umbellata]
MGCFFSRDRNPRDWSKSKSGGRLQGRRSEGSTRGDGGLVSVPAMTMALTGYGSTGHHSSGHHGYAGGGGGGGCGGGGGDCGGGGGSSVGGC